MSPSTLHPKWWQLYLTFPFLIALFVLDARLKISARGHKFVQIGIVLLVYGLILLWLRANRSALAGDVREGPVEIYRVIEIPPAGSPELEGEKRSILELSDSEIQGLLSDGMEISYTDAEIFSKRAIRKN